MTWLPHFYEPDLVSIVVVTHHRAALLSETLAAMLAQTYRPLEIVVVSDGEDDSTTAVVDNIAVPDRVRVNYHVQSASGAPSARNRGAQQARGEYLVFMDDDDLAASDFIASRVEAARATRGQATLVYGPYVEFYRSDDGYYLDEPDWSQPGSADVTPWHSFLLGWNVLLQGCLLHRRLVEQAGPWDESLVKSQDFDYKVRLLQTNCQVAKSQTGIVYYRRHLQSITRTPTQGYAESVLAAFHTLREIAIARPDFPVVRSALADRAWHFGKVLLRLERWADARNMLRDALNIDPAVLDRQPPLVRLLYRLNAVRCWGQYLAWRRRRGKLAIESSAKGPSQQLVLTP